MDESLEDEVRITVIATGFEKPLDEGTKPQVEEAPAAEEKPAAPVEEPSPEQAEILKQLRGEPACPADEGFKIPNFVRHGKVRPRLKPISRSATTAIRISAT